MSFKSVTATVLLIIFSIAYISFSHAKEPLNLDSLKQELIRYHDSGAYSKDIARVVERAKAYLQVRVAQEKKRPSGKKLAIILDIDETALSNYPDMLAMNFGGTLEQVEEAEGRGKDPAIDPTLKLYQFAKENGIAVIFITGRKELYRDSTTANLKSAGYDVWEQLYFRPNDSSNKKIGNFKIAVRKQLIEQGYDIVLSLSDQKGDLRGGYADKAFKLPDPYYLVT